MSRRRYAHSIAALFVALIPLTAIGQETRATLTGTVTDASGSAVTGAHVTIVNVETANRQPRRPTSSDSTVFCS